MKPINPKLVKIIQDYLSGAKLAKFNGSIAVLNESLKQDQWIMRGSVKAESGFYQGLAQRCQFEKDYDVKNNKKAQDLAWSLAHCIQFGVPVSVRHKHFDFNVAFKTFLDFQEKNDYKFKIPAFVVKAWVDLCEEKEIARKHLFEARPKPQITKIGLSPKVTKTLTEMDLDIDISSIKPAPLKPIWVPAFWPDGKPKTDRDGKQEKEKIWIVDWHRGTQLNMTRFYQPMTCEACGKYIPSNMYVPIQATDKKTKKLIGMWVGCDCARNIFGIKDVGIKKEIPKKAKK